jgi:hypothetical protein
MKVLFNLIAISALAGCGGSLKLLEGGKVHQGQYDAVGKTLAVVVDGVNFSGTYITNASSSYGGLFVGARYVPINTYTSGNMGRAILTAANGNVIRCEFMAQSMSAQGTCTDNNGKSYDLIAGQ